VPGGGTGEGAMTNLVFGIFAGAVGVAYFIYGRKQAKFVPLVAGIMLCIYPYFVDGMLWLCLIGAALVAAPFLIDF
jgi:hypothetical protein